MKNRMILWLGVAMLVAAGLAVFSMNVAQANVFQDRPGRMGPQGPRGGFGPGGMHGRRGGPGMLFARLDLNETQKEQLKALHEKARTDAKAYAEQLKPLRESVRAAVEAKTFDDTAVRALFAKESQIMTELRIIRARTENAAYNLLTAEQKTKLAELREHHRPPRDGHPPKSR